MRTSVHGWWWALVYPPVCVWMFLAGLFLAAKAVRKLYRPGLDEQEVEALANHVRKVCERGVHMHVVRRAEKFLNLL